MNSFFTYIQQATLHLPGESAQRQMAPSHRPMRGEVDIEKLGLKESAVVLLIFPKGDAMHFLLMKRPTYDGVHSGQISLPGGRKENIDVNLLDTAMREFEEEVGVSAENLEYVNPLTDLVIPVSKHLVQPYVFYSSTELKFIPDPVEVETLIEIPIYHLLENTRIKEGPFVQGLNVNFPYFELAGEKVWGATAMILSEFKTILHQIPFCLLSQNSKNSKSTG